jgi:esterase/lipase
MFYQKHLFRAFYTLILTFSINACASGVIENRHNPSKQEAVYPEKNFQAYIDNTKNHIKNAIKNTIYEKRGDKLIEDRLPFECRPEDKNPCYEKSNADNRKSQKYKKGVLLIHGLTDTPFIMRDVGNRFAKKGFLVRSILLPGHGTVPGDLLDVEYSQWVKATEKGIEAIKDDVDNLYLVGFSTGSSLSLHHVIERKNPDYIKGLILLSPGVKENTSFGPAAVFAGYLDDTFSSLKWLNLHPDKDNVKYESFATNAGAQFHLLTKDMRNLAEKTSVKKPVYMAISSVDDTVESNIARYFFCNHIKHKNKRMIWYTSKKGAVINKSCQVEEKVISNVAEGILDFAHISLPVKPDNNYYGRAGAYKSCLSYSKSNLPDDQKDVLLGKCKTEAIGGNSKVKFGEHIDTNKEEHVVRRLSFNPDFNNMMDDIFKFIDQL